MTARPDSAQADHFTAQWKRIAHLHFGGVLPDIDIVLTDDIVAPAVWDREHGALKLNADLPDGIAAAERHINGVLLHAAVLRYVDHLDGRAPNAQYRPGDFAARAVDVMNSIGRRMGWRMVETAEAAMGWPFSVWKQKNFADDADCFGRMQ